jgi:hypothetical protein
MDKLNNKWRLWYHSINDTNWDKTSYNNIYDIDNLFDYRFIIDKFNQLHYQNGMFFLMRDNIFPNWEDPDNRNGGCLSFKVSSDKIVNEWNNLFLKCVTDNILKNNHNEINGISISPKKEFNIIKLWFKNHSFNYEDVFYENDNSFILLKDSLFKKHSF